MSELGEIFSAWREEKKEKKISNLEKSIQILDNNNINYDVLSDTHYRISNYDFWPSTGLFINRKTGRKGRGVFNLIRNLQKTETT